jgi:uncharacterized protein YciI
VRHFAIIAWDGPDAATARDNARAAHFARIEGIMENLARAGPLRYENGAFTGSLVIVTATDKATAQAIFDANPYYAAGVWARFEIHDFLPAAGGWVDGTTW